MKYQIKRRNYDCSYHYILLGRPMKTKFLQHIHTIYYSIYVYLCIYLHIYIYIHIYICICMQAHDFSYNVCLSRASLRMVRTLSKHSYSTVSLCSDGVYEFDDDPLTRSRNILNEPRCYVGHAFFDFHRRDGSTRKLPTVHRNVPLPTILDTCTTILPILCNRLK